MRCDTSSEGESSTIRGTLFRRSVEIVVRGEGGESVERETARGAKTKDRSCKLRSSGRGNRRGKQKEPDTTVVSRGR